MELVDDNLRYRCFVWPRDKGLVRSGGGAMMVMLDGTARQGLSSSWVMHMNFLRDLTLVCDPVDFRDDLRLQEMGVGIWQAEIGKDIAASRFNLGLACHHSSPLRETLRPLFKRGLIDLSAPSSTAII
jgi:hypothetical protein